MIYDNLIKGQDCEYLVKEALEDLGYKVNIEDTFYDLKAIKNNKEILIEVKSANFRVRNGSNNFRYGRFDFTDKKNRVLQRKNNVYVCFVMRLKEELVILGLIKAKIIKAKRYVNLIDVLTKRKLRKLESLEK